MRRSVRPSNESSSHNPYTRTLDNRAMVYLCSEVHLDLSKFLQTEVPSQIQSQRGSKRNSPRKPELRSVKTSRARKEEGFRTNRDQDRLTQANTHEHLDRKTKKAAQFDSPKIDSHVFIPVSQTKDVGSQDILSPEPLLETPEPRKPKFIVKKSPARSPGKESRSSSMPRNSQVLDLHSSLYGLSVIQRNQTWLSRKNLKINAERELKAAKCLDGCTFVPVIYTKIPHKLQSKPVEDLLQYTQSTDQIDPKDMQQDYFSPVRNRPEDRQSIESLITTSTVSIKSPDLKGHTRNMSAGEPLSIKELSPFRVRLKEFNPDAFVKRLKCKSKK